MTGRRGQPRRPRSAWRRPTAGPPRARAAIVYVKRRFPLNKVGS